MAKHHKSLKPNRSLKRAVRTAADPVGAVRNTVADGRRRVLHRTTKVGGTRARLVESARKLFLRVGYEATGIADILEDCGVNSGSLYYFFRAKEDLLLAVLDWYLANLYPQVIDPACKKTDDALERVFAVMDGYRQLLMFTECRIGCPIGNLALEMSEKSERVRKKIAENFANWRKAIRDMLRAATERFPVGVDVEALSVFILTVMEGGVMQARAHRDVSYFDASVAVLRDYLHRLVEPGAGPVSLRLSAEPPPPAARSDRWKKIVHGKGIHP